MLEDDELANNSPKKLKNLDPLSLDELESYIEALNNEIKRVEDEIEKKKAHRDVASNFFK